ncbi:hypothetical protein Patl1_34513 [Pistacia atlantica]|uniref:Uncharacterized protein n=1 Tax=Pistacia atlantica TaxID=434234 RepID=A0ACC0ZVX2_9ROSI|nr:hypothetical protein Patl1_34513 [Pistacia atlantica]
MIVFLEIKSGDLVLYAGYQTPQTYWSSANDSRKTNSSVGGKVHSAYLEPNAWNFHDQNKKLLCQFVFTKNTNPNATWAAILGSDGTITFSDLHKENQGVGESALGFFNLSIVNLELLQPVMAPRIQWSFSLPARSFIILQLALLNPFHPILRLANKLAFVTAPALHCSLEIVNGTSDGSGNKGKKTINCVHGYCKHNCDFYSTLSGTMVPEKEEINEVFSRKL